MTRITYPTTPEATSTKSRRELEQSLLVAAQAGSATAFGELCALYAKPLHRVAFSITRNQEDAEDALQDSFMRAYTGLSRFRGEAQVYSWLVRITMNSALMLLRKRRSRREFAVEGFAGPDEHVVQFELPDPHPDPEQHYVQKQVYSRLLRKIKRLPCNLRVAAELRFLQERSMEETEQMLGISEAAVKSRLFRVRARLATLQSPTNAPRELAVYNG